MDDASNATLWPRGYQLSEEGHAKLQEIRDQLFMIASLTFAATMQEEHTPVEVRRSMLGQCFENFGLQIDDVLDGLKLPERVRSGSVREH